MSRSNGTRVGLGFLLLGVLLAALVFGGDRLAARVAEGRAGQLLQGQLGTPTAPTVDVGGFPFLTQVLRGRLDRVHVVGDDITPPDRPGTALGRADLQLRDVSSPDRYRTFSAGQVDGTVTLDYASAKQLSGYPVKYAQGGRVVLTLERSLQSVPLTPEVTGRPVVDAAAQTFSLGDPEVRVGGIELGGGSADALLGTLLKPVPITGIPYGLSVTDIEATPDGLRVGVTGRDISFSR